MLRLLGLVISIGMADSLNPSTVGPALYLAGGERPRRDVLQFTLGTFVVMLAGGLLITLGPGSAILAIVPRPRPLTRYILETAAGVAMLVASAVVWLRRHRLGRDESSEETPKRRGSPVLMGATIAIVELPTAFPYFAAIVAIIGSGLRIPDKIVLLALYNLCFVVPLLAIILTITVAGERAVELISSVRDFMLRHWPIIVAGVGLLAGAFVTLLGVTGLGTRQPGQVGTLARRVRHLITH